jgi:hypothetical protein
MYYQPKQLVHESGKAPVSYCSSTSVVRSTWYLVQYYLVLNTGGGAATLGLYQYSSGTHLHRMIPQRPVTNDSFAVWIHRSLELETTKTRRVWGWWNKNISSHPTSWTKDGLYRVGKGLCCFSLLLKLRCWLLSQGENTQNQPAERRLWTYRAPIPVNGRSCALEYLELW